MSIRIHPSINREEFQKKLQKQNIHNEIYAEVEKISYKLLQLI